jgi:hypothetical protein
MATIGTVFPPMEQSVGGGIGIVIFWIAAKYFFRRSRWIPFAAIFVGFIVGQMIVGHVLISMGSYKPIVVPDPK